jgi:TRAP-type C4-dicarboxylate transport system substrate-binding protein
VVGIVLIIIGLPLHPLTIKIGSIAPIGSPWDEALKVLAAEWDELSDGAIQLKAYMGGIAGDETDLVRKIRLGQLQAAAITELGLNRVTQEVLALSVPFLIRDDGEFDYVLSEMTPYFDGLAEERGFTVLAWIKAGWVHFFSKEPVVYPADLKKQPLAVPDGDPEILHAWQDLGFRSLPLSIPDYLLGLQSGMIGALYAPPLVAAVYQWFGIANHMCSLAITPVVAAIIVDNRVWSRVDPELKPLLLAAVDRIRRDLEKETNQLTFEGIAVMQNYGLTVHPVPGDAEEEWRATVRKGFELVVGESFRRETYEKIVELIQEYRSR